MTLQRTESFVPLTTLPTSGEHQEFRITVIPKNGQTRPLQSLDPAAPAPTGGGLGAEKTGEPRVSLQYDGDRVTHIRVQCSCGQIMDLACVYEPVAKPA
jgi:hypothetical protein